MARRGRVHDVQHAARGEGDVVGIAEDGAREAEPRSGRAQVQHAFRVGVDDVDRAVAGGLDPARVVDPRKRRHRASRGIDPADHVAPRVRDEHGAVTCDRQAVR